MVASSEPSRLPFRFQLSNRDPPWPRTEDPSQLELTRFGINVSLAELMTDVSDLYVQLKDISKTSDYQTAFAIVVELCCILQSLVTFSSRNPSNYALTEACRQACALFIFDSAQQFYPAPTLLANTLVHGLKTSVVHAMDYYQTDHDNTLFAWTVYIGAVASMHLTEHGWFIDHLAFPLDSMEIRSAAELEERLGYIVAFGTFTDGYATQIWNEVEGRLSKV